MGRQHGVHSATRAVEDRRVPLQEEGAVGAGEHREDLERDLRRFGPSVDLPEALRVLDPLLEQAEPRALLRRDHVAQLPRMTVHLGRDRSEEAPARERATTNVVEEAQHEGAHARHACRRGQPRSHHLFLEDLLRHPDRLELQLFLGAEVGEEPALREPDVLGEGGDRQSVETFHGGEGGRGPQDLLVAALPVRATSAGPGGTRLPCGGRFRDRGRFRADGPSHVA
jgi:hypothetical protein